jgi:hypothetical protein
MSGPGPGGPRRLPGLLLLLAVVAGAAVACTSDPEPADPEEALVRTVQGTLDGAFAYRLVAEADRAAVEALGQDLGSVAARLNLFEVTGVVTDDAVSMDLSLFATAPLLEVRRFGDPSLYLRVAAGDGPLAAVATPELEGRMLGMAVRTSQPQSVVSAIGALSDGAWIGVEGAFDPTGLADLAGGDGDVGTEEPTATASTPLPDLLAQYLRVTDRVEEDGTTTLTVDLRVRALLRALASLGTGDTDVAAVEEGLAVLPEEVTGDVVTHDGVVEAIVFDVAADARAAGEDVPGSLELRLELSEHGAPTAPERPAAQVTVPSGELTAGLAQLLATPPPAPPASPGESAASDAP